LLAVVEHAAGMLRSRALLCVAGAGNGITCGGEHAKESVALRVDLDTAMRRKGIAQHRVVIRERVSVRLLPELLQQFRRSLHVGEEKCDRPGREVAAHRTIMRHDRRHVTRWVAGQ
jgi:hypothetical protein